VQRIANREVLRADRLCVSIAGREILTDVDLSVFSGERVAVLGKSGAGKSTLLGSLVASPTPTSGTLKILGKNLANLSTKELRLLRQRTGHISQGFDLVDDLSAIENVLLGDFAKYRIPRLWSWTYSNSSNQRAKTLLSNFNLTEKALQRAGSLSGGERQRVAIARALMSEPRVIFADEPISALDVDSSKIVLEDLKQVANDGVAVIAALHQIEAALGWATQIVVLSNGRVVAQGPVSQFNNSKLTALISEG
jgi:phosphonate transport system ATP-binding protein